MLGTCYLFDNLRIKIDMTIQAQLDLSTKKPLIYDGPIAARHYLPMVDYQRAWAWCRAQMISTEDEAPITLIQIYLFR